MQMISNTTIFIGSFLIITEIIYILVCKFSSRKEVEKNWIPNKSLSLFGSFAICIFGLMCYFILKEASKTFNMNMFKFLGVAILILLGIICYFYLNKYLGLWVSKGKKKCK